MAKKIHVDIVIEPGADERAADVERAFRESLGRYLFSEDERSIAEIVLDAARSRGLDIRGRGARGPDAQVRR